MAIVPYTIDGKEYAGEFMSSKSCRLCIALLCASTEFDRTLHGTTALLLSMRWHCRDHITCHKKRTLKKRIVFARDSTFTSILL